MTAAEERLANGVGRNDDQRWAVEELLRLRAELQHARNLLGNAAGALLAVILSSKAKPRGR